MTLKELFNILIEELGGRRLASGEPGRPVRGVAVDEETEGWLGPDEVVVTTRQSLDPRFLAACAKGGSPAVVWRAGGETPEDVAGYAGELGLGLIYVPANVPLRALLSLFARDAEGEGLLRHSHGAARALLESAGSDEDSIARLVGKLADLLDRPEAWDGRHLPPQARNSLARAVADPAVLARNLAAGGHNLRPGPRSHTRHCSHCTAAAVRTASWAAAGRCTHEGQNVVLQVQRTGDAGQARHILLRKPCRQHRCQVQVFDEVG